MVISLSFAPLDRLPDHDEEDDNDEWRDFWRAIGNSPVMVATIGVLSAVLFLS